MKPEAQAELYADIVDAMATEMSTINKLKAIAGLMYLAEAYGCMDKDALNFDPEAIHPTDTCIYAAEAGNES